MTAMEIARRVWRDLGEGAEVGPSIPLATLAPLPSMLDVSSLALGSVGVAAHAAALLAGAQTAGSTPRIELDPDRVAASFTRERSIAIDGRPPDVWAPLSGFWRTRDGWIRTHANYPHHRLALTRALGLPDHAGAEALAARIAPMPTVSLVGSIEASGGICASVNVERPDLDAGLERLPLLEVTHLGPGRQRILGGSRELPLRGIRVLDLTRVIAGPVCTQTLALFGADVLRIDPPNPAEIAWQHIDTGQNKRTAIVDLTTSDGLLRFDELVGAADVIVLGYRPSSLGRLGITAELLAARAPGAIIAQLSAWGFKGDQGHRAGFDSIVQAASGIAWIEAAGDEHPGAMPAQALDHATGYLLAAGVMSLLRRQTVEGGTWSLRASLRRTAAALLTSPRPLERTPTGSLSDGARSSHIGRSWAGRTFIDGVLPCVGFEGSARKWEHAAHPLGSDDATWSHETSERP